MTHLPALTGLRFLAAIHVVLFHLRDTFTFPVVIANIVSYGSLGVNLFFILSGFVLAYTYLDVTKPANHIDVRGFWVARVARVYPLYLFAFVLAAPRVLAKGDVPDGLVTATAVSTVTLTQAWTGWIEWNVPAWSLSVEAFFYLVFPPTAVAVWRLRRRGVLLCAAIAWIASLIGPAVFVALGSDPRWRDVVLYNPLLRLPEFVIGIALARIFLLNRAQLGTAEQMQRWQRRSTWWATAGALGILSVMACTLPVPGVFFHNGLLDPLFAVLIYGLAGGGGVLGALLGTRIFRLLGEASYGIYILQQPVASWCKAIVSLILTGGLGMASTLKTSQPFAVGYMLTLVLVSLATLYVIEMPMRAAIRRWWLGFRGVVPALTRAAQ